jgi:hypothetical protein
MKGWDVLYAELLEKTWKEKMDEWSKRPKGEGCDSLYSFQSCGSLHSLDIYFII